MERMFDGYRKGYLKALMDVRELIAAHDVQIKWSYLNNTDGIIRILDEMIKNRDEMMNYAENCELTIKQTEKEIKKQRRRKEKYLQSHLDNSK